MIAQNEFQDLMREVVASEFPDELEAFDEGGDRVINKIYATGTAADPGRNVRQFQFIAEATTVLTFVKLAAGTFLALKKVWDAFHPAQGEAAKEATLIAEWQKQLMDAGIPEEKAKAIAARFSADLVKRLAS